jgi:hypothetical protein
MLHRIVAASLVLFVSGGPAIALAQSDSDTTTYSDTLRKNSHSLVHKAKATVPAGKHSGHAKKSSVKKRLRRA